MLLLPKNKIFSLLNLFNCMTGNNAVWNHFLDKLLGLMIEQKRLILSDRNFLPSLLATLLGSSSQSFLVPQSIEQRCVSKTSPLFKQNFPFNNIFFFEAHRHTKKLHFHLKKWKTYKKTPSLLQNGSPTLTTKEDSSPVLFFILEWKQQNLSST